MKRRMQRSLSIALVLSLLVVPLFLGAKPLLAAWGTPAERIPARNLKYGEQFEAARQQALETPISEAPAPPLEEGEGADTDADVSEDDESESDALAAEQLKQDALKLPLWILMGQVERENARNDRDYSAVVEPKEGLDTFASAIAEDYEAEFMKKLREGRDAELWLQALRQTNTVATSPQYSEIVPELLQALEELKTNRTTVKTETDIHFYEELDSYVQSLHDWSASVQLDPGFSAILSKPWSSPELARIFDTSFLEQLLKLNDAPEAANETEAEPAESIVQDVQLAWTQTLAQWQKLSELRMMTRGFDGVLMQGSFVNSVDDELIKAHRDALQNLAQPQSPDTQLDVLRQELLILESYVQLATWREVQVELPEEEIRERWQGLYNFTQDALLSLADEDYLMLKSQALRSDLRQPEPVTGLELRVVEGGKAALLSWDTAPDDKAPDYYVIMDVSGDGPVRLAATAKNYFLIEPLTENQKQFTVHGVRVVAGEEYQSADPQNPAFVEVPLDVTPPEPSTTTEPTTTPEPTTTAEPTTEAETTTTGEPSEEPTTEVTEEPTSEPTTAPEETTTEEPTTTPEPSEDATTEAEPTTEPTEPFVPGPVPEPTEPQDDAVYARADEVTLDEVKLTIDSEVQEAFVEQVEGQLEQPILYVDAGDFDHDGETEAFILTEGEEAHSYELYFVREGDETPERVEGSELLLAPDLEDRYFHITMDDEITLIYFLAEDEAGETRALVMGLKDQEPRQFELSARGTSLGLFDPADPNRLPLKPGSLEPEGDFGPEGSQKFILYNEKWEGSDIHYFDRAYYVFRYDTLSFAEIADPMPEESREPEVVEPGSSGDADDAGSEAEEAPPEVDADTLDEAGEAA